GNPDRARRLRAPAAALSRVRRSDGRALLALCRRHLGGALPIEAGEIDGIDEERRKAALAHRVRDDLSTEGEELARAFDHDHRMHGLLGDIGQAENAAVDELESKQEVRRLAGLPLDQELDLEIAR